MVFRYGQVTSKNVTDLKVNLMFICAILMTIAFVPRVITGFKPNSEYTNKMLRLWPPYKYKTEVLPNYMVLDIVRIASHSFIVSFLILDTILH